MNYDPYEDYSSDSQPPTPKEIRRFIFIVTVIAVAIIVIRYLVVYL